MNSVPAAPPVLSPLFFGAFDRHNFGDILLGHTAVREAEVAVPRCAGLAERDLRACGGFLVAPVDALIAPVTLIHVGGELLDCDAGQVGVLDRLRLDRGRAIPLSKNAAGSTRSPAPASVRLTSLPASRH